ncbi:MAG: rRNA pseudouridine synthase [Acidimicrobiia bacterium]|nr:rRNA pseudouridine synthase [Acidimicrobiia bacterium]MDH5505406.1 rRNA pseudouridine synthase [Acidimicrobiia bacterium]
MSDPSGTDVAGFGEVEPDTEKLQKVIARSGVASRRMSERLIEERRVTVDGVVAHLGMRVNPSAVTVEVDGSEIPVDPTFEYYLLNKPVGIISTADDPQGRETVVNLIPTEQRIYPVGRLDQDSAGLLILTNDGALTARLTHPRYNLPKVYNVLVEGSVSGSVLNRFTTGIELEDGLAVAQSARVVDRSSSQTMLELVLTEGRNREIRRMAEAVGHDVISLFRAAIGPIRDGGLRSGMWRKLTPDEVRSLYDATNA